MTVYSEEAHTINIGNGLYTAELAASIPDGYVPEAYNVIATGETLENRTGFIQTSIDYKKAAKSFGYWQRFYELVQFNPDWPVLAFPYGTDIHFIRSSQGFTAGTPSGDGYMTITNPFAGETVLSLCQYSDRTYVSTSAGIKAITAYNWSTDAITAGTVVGGPAGLTNLFSYKDRLWGISSDRLYYTDIASVTSPYPETWSSTTNFEVFRQDRGAGIIQDVIPLGNKLLVFTVAGLFSLLVEGSPESWIKKNLDVRSSTTRPQSAFEAMGIVYYVNTTGIYATNGIDTAKVSAAIDDKFQQPNTSLRHSIRYLDDGILLSISKHFKDGSGNIYIDGSASELYYTKLDPIAWTQWGIEGTDEYPSAFGNFRISEVMDVISNTNTFLNLSPITLLLLSTSDGTEASPKDSALQLVVYDGYQNQLITWNGSVYATIADPVKTNIVTRFTDGGASIKEKRCKYAYLEAYTSDEFHEITTKFVVDAAGETVPYNITVASAGDNVNLIKIPCDTRYRRISSVIASELQSSTSQLKFKAVHLIDHTGRNEPDSVR